MIQSCPLCKGSICVCDKDKGKNGVIAITAEALKEKINKQPDLLLINVLSKDYFDDCHIKGSINIPFDVFEKRISELDKNRDIVVYCSNYMCSASAAAYKILKKNGFEKVKAFEGGMKEWYDKGYPSQGACALTYLK